MGRNCVIIIIIIIITIIIFSITIIIFAIRFAKKAPTSSYTDAIAIIIFIAIGFIFNKDFIFKIEKVVGAVYEMLGTEAGTTGNAQVDWVHKDFYDEDYEDEDFADENEEDDNETD